MLNKKKKIGIVLLATNAYFLLGIRFIKRFSHYYKGDCDVKFFFFSDEDPVDYIPENIDVSFYKEKHGNWLEGTNSKFKNIISIEDDFKISEVDYVYYFDADTNIDNNFTEEWFLGDMVGGEHFANRCSLKGGVGLDKNPLSKAYVPIIEGQNYTYYYGAFFGGLTTRVLDFCKLARYNQLEDHKINYEPAVNDESYINQIFATSPPTYTVETSNFKFAISHKGGLDDTRNTLLNTDIFKQTLRELKYSLLDIRDNKIIVEI